MPAAIHNEAGKQVMESWPLRAAVLQSATDRLVQGKGLIWLRRQNVATEWSAVATEKRYPCTQNTSINNIHLQYFSIENTCTFQTKEHFSVKLKMSNNIDSHTFHFNSHITFFLFLLLLCFQMCSHLLYAICDTGVK